MRKALLFASFIAIVVRAAFGQNSTKPVFEVASVRVTTPANDGRALAMQCNGGPGTSDPERLRCTNAPLMMLICIAYGVQYYQVFGPGWIATDGYDISAKIPAGVTRVQYGQMLQSLIAERFQLVLHHETRNSTAYSLVVAKGGIKIQRTPERSSAAPPGIVVVTPTNANSRIRITAIREPLSNLAGFLSTKQGVESSVTNDAQPWPATTTSSWILRLRR